MFLQKIEIAGFKSFANKTALEFFPPKAGSFSVTGIVGPNGSGKSNVSDAIRWVLGEQSMKLLRGKKGEDVIFSGSGSATRKSLAEVSLILNNEDRTLDDFGTEISITRRLYRSGDSEYLINKQAVRLTDIAFLLARAHVGHNSYSVIGQGMVDHVVVASPAERKQFFDEATGVKEFQMKREQTVSKLRRSRENMREAELLLREIEPRLRSLRRQVNRLSEKEEVQTELEKVRKQYYGFQYKKLSDARDQVLSKLKELTRNEEKAQRGLDTLLSEMKELEQQQEEAPDLADVQAEYEQLLEKRQEAVVKKSQLQSAMAVAQARSETPSTRAMIDADFFRGELEALENEHRALEKSIKEGNEASVGRALERFGNSIKGLLKRVTGDKPKQPQKIENNDSAQKEVDELQGQVVVLNSRIADLRRSIADAAKKSSTDKSAFFELQRSLQEKQNVVHQAESAMHEADISRTRVQTQLEALEQEISDEAPEMLEIIKHVEADELLDVDVAALRPRMHDLRRKVDMIESIDPQVQKEFKELDERYTGLNTQVEDLTASVMDLENVVRELDRRIAHQRSSAFTELAQQFEHFFKILFNGGKAELVPIEAKKVEEEDEEGDLVVDKTPKDPWAGIEITATPPGKKIQSIQTLSGGERAMTAIALLCAIVTINPSPFVVLDEVDAALDEGNAARFADIVKELSAKVQFILITHNRTTMQAADALYGVTMGPDGISTLLSMKFEEARVSA